MGPNAVDFSHSHVSCYTKLGEGIRNEIPCLHSIHAPNELLIMVKQLRYIHSIAPNCNCPLDESLQDDEKFIWKLVNMMLKRNYRKINLLENW